MQPFLYLMLISAAAATAAVNPDLPPTLTPNLAPILPRQANTARFTGLTATGSGCDGRSFRTTVSANGQSITVTFNDFNAGVGGNDRNSATCTIRFDMIFPIGCTSMGVIGNFRGFGQFPSSVSARLVNNYSITRGQFTENNDAHEFSGARFADGATFSVQDAVAVLVRAASQSEQSVKFNVGVNLIVSPATSARAGAAQVDSIDFAINRQISCW